VIVNAGGSGSVSIPDALDAVFGIGVITGTIAETLPAAVLFGIKDPQSAIGVSRMLAALDFTYMLLRQQMPASFFEPAYRPYIDSPNLLIAKAQGTGSQGEIQLAMDLTLKGYRIVPIKEIEQGDALLFYNYLANGVIDHIVERAIISLPESAQSVGALFEAASSQNIGAKALVPQTTTGFELDLTPEGKRRVENSLREGNIIFVPEQRPTGWESRSLGWWEINPLTGWTQDMTEAGYHTSAIEKQIQLNQTLRTTPAVRRFGCQLAVAYTLVGGTAAQVGESLTAIGNPAGAVLSIAGELASEEKLADMLCGGKLNVWVKGGKLPKLRPQNWKIPVPPWVKKIGPFGGGRFGKWR
jgi:hypothetical protein